MSIWSNLNSLFCSIFILMYHFYSAEPVCGRKGEFTSQCTSQRSLPELLWRIWKIFHSSTEFIYRHKAFIKHEQPRGQHQSLTVMYARLVGTLWRSELLGGEINAAKVLDVDAFVTESTPSKFPEPLWLPALFVDYRMLTVWLSLLHLLQLMPQCDI